MKKYLHVALLVSVLLLALCIRVFRLEQVPAALYIDEVAMFVEMASVRMHGTDIHGSPWYQVIYPSYGDYKMPVYIWLAVASSYIFGVTQTALKFPTIMAGVLTVVAGFFLTRILLGFTQRKTQSSEQFLLWLKVTALSTAVVLALTPWSIIFSRAAFEGHLAQFLLGISVVLQLYAVRKKSLPLGILAILCATAATYTYYSVRFVWIGVYAAVWILYLRRYWDEARKKLLLITGIAVSGILLYGVTLIPLYRSPHYAATNFIRLNTDSVLKLNGAEHTINAYRMYAGNTVFDKLYINRYIYILRELLSNYSEHLSLSFLFTAGDPNLRHGTGVHGVFLAPMLIFLLLGVIYLSKGQKAVLALLLIWILCAVLPASVPENTPHALRSLNALLPFSVIIGVGLAVTLMTIHRSSSLLLRSAAVSSIGLLILSFGTFYIYYHTQYAVLSRDAWTVHITEIAQTIEQLRTEDQPVYVTQISDKFFLWMLAKGEYLAKGIQTEPDPGYILDRFNGITVGSLPTDATESSIIATTKGQWEKFAAEYLVQPDALYEFTALDGSVYVVARLP